MLLTRSWTHAANLAKHFATRLDRERKLWIAEDKISDGAPIFLASNPMATRGMRRSKQSMTFQCDTMAAAGTIEFTARGFLFSLGQNQVITSGT